MCRVGKQSVDLCLHSSDIIISIRIVFEINIYFQHLIHENTIDSAFNANCRQNNVKTIKAFEYFNGWPKVWISRQIFYVWYKISFEFHSNIKRVKHFDQKLFWYLKICRSFDTSLYVLSKCYEFGFIFQFMLNKNAITVRSSANYA